MPSPITIAADEPRAPRLVLDTNIVLDWLVFGDDHVAELRKALSERRVELITHPLAVEELQRVLAYPQCQLGPSAQQEVLERYRRATSVAAMPANFRRDSLLLPHDFPRCRDRDDQYLLALAYHGRAEGLVTKDKAVLRLRSRAGRFGVAILDVARLRSLLASSAVVRAVV